MLRTFTDIHSHILPGADDGAKDKAQAIELLRQMQDIGVDKLIFTPHYCKRREYTKSVSEIKEIFDDFVITCKNEGIKIKMYLGTEMEYSTDAVRYIREERVLRLADSSYILLEFPPYVKKDTVITAVKEICQLGLIPIIAHVERYKHLQGDFETILTLKNIGAQLQINIRSVCACRFKMKRFLKKIISGELADYLAGDVHLSAIEKKEFDKCCQFVIKNSSSKYLDRLLAGNAKNIINGR